ncbi:hypothetical protein [Citrobacter phage CVT22]|uniref:Uncharacterized protein n=1 Tax=Citrobacter phage CVT22 TaxID=1622234 RepID=A0A0R6CFS5_9CAUD|nr:hypothetical protein APL39_gp30 [Citrobacter phage CVT22]AJT60734.1 hypothetical protein [Citrobacter phage CVT22]
MKTVRNILAFPFIVVGVIVLSLGMIILGGLVKTGDALGCMKKGLEDGKVSK